ncbi:SNF2 helicase associated domain-containing protein [Fredinandcohnia sp. 179-A 10B2 NHS]|uniref:DEAD/DEAH box helicase n=1 Tax=Fredinandcohnia sp. 179-A 10B2 NHS TaxID=3235176 RepID=UPI00399F91BB
MNIKVTHKQIKDLCGTVSFKKGDTFFRTNKVKFTKYNQTYCEATVTGSEEFYVTIESSNYGGKLQTTCSCPTLKTFQKDCQHIAAVLLAIHDQQQRPNEYPADTIKKGPTNVQNLELAEGLMTLFSERKVKPSGSQRHFEKREVLDLKFSCVPIFLDDISNMFGISVYLGENKATDIKDFLTNVKRGKKYTFSKGFVYHPSNHCFSPQADVVIQQMIAVAEDENAYFHTKLDEAVYLRNNHILVIPPSSWEDLMPSLELGSLATLEYQGQSINFKVDKGPLPLHFSFSEQKNESIELTIKGFENLTIFRSYNMALSGTRLFKLNEQDCTRLLELRQMLNSPEGNQIAIPNDKMESFITNIVPELKKIGVVHLPGSLTRQFSKAPLVARLYLDRLKNRLLAGLEFHYENIIIQPLESNEEQISPFIIRDYEKEEEILELMEESLFSKTDGGYYMYNEELEYNFLYHTVPKLQQLVQVYATTAVRNRIFRGNPPLKIRVKVKKERTNWLEFNFEMDGIPDQHIRDILTALEEKRKYYRLRDGTLLSLESREMEEIQRFLKAVPVQHDDIEAELNMPIIQSLKFLDSVEHSEVFKIEESFRDFLDKIHYPEKLEFEVPNQLEFILRPYQKKGYKWMKSLASYGFGGVLADEMGLGKTLQSITYIASELENIREKNLPILIISPTSLTYNWLAEIMKFAPTIQAIVIDGKKSDREELQKQLDQVDVIITSYNLLRKDIKWYETQVFHTVFFDEAQAFKNPVTQTARAVKKIQADTRFGLTGTPIENSIEELWSIYHVIFPQLFQGLKEYSHLSRKDIARRLRPFMLRRVKKDVVSELPDKIESIESSELLPEQKKLYAAYLAKLRQDTLKHLDRDTMRKNRIKILAGLTRLRQICCHPALFVDGYKGSSAKYEQLLQVLEEARLSGKRVLIFSQFTKMLKLIGSELTKRRYSYFYLDGQTPSVERVDLCNKFNEGERDIFLISLKAGGTGLNLTGADTVILYDIWWNPAVEEQATDRAHRIGQTNNVQVIKLVSRGTIEEKINELQDKKRHLIGELIDSENKGSTALTEDDIKEILMI